MNGTRATGDVALVTGAGKRIGRHIALDLAAHGWRVGVHYHSSPVDAEAVVALIEAAGGSAVAVRADLDAENEVRALVPQVREALGPVSLLVNNASIFEPDSLASLDDPAEGMWKYHEHLQVNLTAPLLLTRALVRELPEGQEGNVVNILDQKVWRLTPYFFSYTLSKAALWTATQTLAQALAPQVRINAIGPGPILPNARQSEAEFAHQCENLPLERCASPEEIAAAIRFLVATPSMTGQMLALDGGRHLAWQTPDVTNKHD